MLRNSEAVETIDEVNLRRSHSGGAPKVLRNDYIVLPLIIASFFMSLFRKLNRITYWLKAFIVAWTIVVTFILSLIITGNELGAGIITFTLTPIILEYVHG